MPFTVETGGGSEASNAYVSVAFVDDFHQLRGNAVWFEAGDAEKEEAIIRATDYIDKRFGPNFRGEKQNMFQALEWPRLGAYDDSDFWLQDVPVRLQRAAAEYALRALIYVVLAPDPIRPVPGQSFESGSTTTVTTTPTPTGTIVAQSVKIGAIEKSTRYSDPSQRNRLTTTLRETQSGIVNDFNIPEYPEADMWIAGLLRSKLFVDMIRG